MVLEEEFTKFLNHLPGISASWGTRAITNAHVSADLAALAAVLAAVAKAFAMTGSWGNICRAVVVLK